METACILRCIGVAVFAASLQAGAQPPQGKGKPEDAGPSPFIRFPVPQHSVGVIRRVQLRTFGDLPSPHGKAGSDQVIEISTARATGVGPANAKAEKGPDVSFATSAGVPGTEKKAPLPECGAR